MTAPATSSPSEKRVLPAAIDVADHLAATGDHKRANDVRALIRSFRASVRTNRALHADILKLREVNHV